MVNTDGSIRGRQQELPPLGPLVQKSTQWQEKGSVGPEFSNPFDDENNDSENVDPRHSRSRSTTRSKSLTRSTRADSLHSRSESRSRQQQYPSERRQRSLSRVRDRPSPSAPHAQSPNDHMGGRSHTRSKSRDSTWNASEVQDGTSASSHRRSRSQVSRSSVDMKHNRQKSLGEVQDLSIISGNAQEAFDLLDLHTSKQGSEMAENTLFARNVGLFDREGEDIATNVDRIPQDNFGDDVLVPAHISPRHAMQDNVYEGEYSSNATFLMPGDIHPNMLHSEEDIVQLRLHAGQLSAEWRGSDFMAPALARRLRDFQFAQEKRRKKFGDERPWGILGLYDHLAAIRIDVEWAEDAAWRRVNGEPYLAWSDFEASKSSGINRPFFTYFILVVCTAALITSIGLNGWVVEELKTNPMIGPSAQTLIDMGAKKSNLIVNENQAWRLVSPMILHAGLVHYVFNMLALWFIGSAVEKSHGSIAAFILFIIPAIGGTILSAIFLPQFISVGASGGIFGLIGACLSDIVMNWNLLFSGFVNPDGQSSQHVMVLVFLFLDIVVNCALGLTPFVDNFTHLGGMVFGFLCGLSTMERLSSDFFGVEHGCWGQAKQIFFRFFGLIVSVLGIVAATVVLLQGDGATTPCENCTALSCIAFPPWESADNKWWHCDSCATATADVTTNTATGVFETLHINCPNDLTVSVDLDSSKSYSRKSLKQGLPSYCREYCLLNQDSRALF